MKKLGSVLIVSAAIGLTTFPHCASAQGKKWTPNIAKRTATGKHFDRATLAPDKPNKPVTEQKASNLTSRDVNPDSTGAGTGRGPQGNPNSTGAGTSRGPQGNPNSTGAGAGRGPNNNPSLTATGGPKLTPEKATVKNLSR